MLYLIVGWLYLGSGLVVDYPWFVVLWAIWAGGVVVLIRVFRRSPFWTPLVAVSAVAIWVVFVQLGSWLLGWSA